MHITGVRLDTWSRLADAGLTPIQLRWKYLRFSGGFGYLFKGDGHIFVELGFESSNALRIRGELTVYELQGAAEHQVGPNFHCGIPKGGVSQTGFIKVELVFLCRAKFEVGCVR